MGNNTDKIYIKGNKSSLYLSVLSLQEQMAALVDLNKGTIQKLLWEGGINYSWWVPIFCHCWKGAP